MKYCKFEKIKGGNDPIIRITYKTWWGQYLIKDVSKSGVLWYFMESGKRIFNYEPISIFNKSGKYSYRVNETIL